MTAVAPDTPPTIWSSVRKTDPRPGGASDVRTPFEQDFDRLLFSTPVRRLADKTQVFPLERNDSVRTRLTHSHEVSNLAKSMGTRLLRRDATVFGDAPEAKSDAPIILATIGLAHDLGNPPFGHQGEEAISRWFKEHARVFSEFGDSYGDATNVEVAAKFVPVDESQRTDFTKFEGNAQALRLVSRLQNTSGKAGLNLTAATIAALIKYPVRSHETAKAAIKKKHGYFASEQDVVDWMRSKTGLAHAQRHPLTWLMEASDDIAYSVLDIEDAIKKGLVSAEDLLAYLRSQFYVTDLGGLTNQLAEDFKKADDDQSTSLSRVREIKATYLRTRLVERLVTGATNEYLADRAAIFEHRRSTSLLECDSDESKLCDALKSFARVHAYQSPAVLALELRGSVVIRELMDAMWEAIVTRKKFLEPDSRRQSPKAAFVYSLISDSYRWHFERPDNPLNLSMRYRELQLLSDMISGMTDGYALDLHKRIVEASSGR